VGTVIYVNNLFSVPEPLSVDPKKVPTISLMGKQLSDTKPFNKVAVIMANRLDRLYVDITRASICTSVNIYG
jgi:hypothetical protein